MRLPRSFADVLARQRRLSLAAFALCLPLAASGGLRFTLLFAALASPPLALIWIGARLSDADAGELLTSPAWKEGVGKVLAFVGWVFLVRVLAAAVGAFLLWLG